MSATNIAILALIVSCISLLYSVWLNSNMRHYSSLSNNLSSILEVEKMIGKNKNLLKYHDIDISEVDKSNIPVEELSYLLMSFTAGGLYYKIASPKDTSPFKNEYPESYRYRMCQAEATQNAWPFIEKMMSDSPYKEKIANTINSFKRNQNQSTP